jgi:hypothetical protein
MEPQHAAQFYQLKIKELVSVTSKLICHVFTSINKSLYWSALHGWGVQVKQAKSGGFVGQ